MTEEEKNDMPQDESDFSHVLWEGKVRLTNPIIQSVKGGEPVLKQMYPSARK